MALYYVQNDYTDPCFNLAFEEYFLHKGTDEYFMLWRNAPAVIIGKYQNAFAEVNLAYAKNHGIRVVRRSSGGGAVYHDLGNLNYSFLLNRPPGQLLDLQAYSLPIVKALKALPLDAELNGRNDITVAGRKISGNAQRISNERILHHGTLLYDVDFSHMREVLTVDAEKIAAKGLSSVAARVANIKEFLPEAADFTHFYHLLKQYIWQDCAIAAEYHCSAQDLAAIQALSAQRYQDWQWNIGNSPEASFQRKRRLAAGSFASFIDIDHGRISKISIYGDFFATTGWEELLAGLHGLPYEQEAVAAYLAPLDIAQICPGLSAADLLSCLFAAE